MSIGSVLSWIICGLVVGICARFLVPGRQQLSLPMTALLGIGGASIAGSQARAIYGPEFVVWFTLGLSATLLIFAQIVPKILGVTLLMTAIHWAVAREPMTQASGRKNSTQKRPRG